MLVGVVMIVGVVSVNVVGLFATTLVRRGHGR